MTRMGCAQILGDMPGCKNLISPNLQVRWAQNRPPEVPPRLVPWVFLLTPRGVEK